MNNNTKLLHFDKQSIIVVTFVILLFIVSFIAPYFVTPIIISLIPLVIYSIFFKTSILTVILISLLFFRVQELAPVLQPFRIVLISTSLVILSFFINLYEGKIKLYWTAPMNNFLIFFGVVTLGLILSSDFSLGYQYWSSNFIKVFVFFYIICWTIKNKNDFLGISVVIMLCGLFLSFIAIYNNIYKIGLVENARVTIGIKQGILGDPNDLALNLLIPFSFALSVLFSSYASKKFQLLSLIIAIFLTIGIFITRSRGGMIGLGCVLLYFIYSRFRYKSVLLVLLPVLLVLLYIITHLSHGNPSPTEGGLDVSSLNRIAAWKAAINMAIHHPVFGVGLMQFSDNFFNFASSADLSNHELRTDLVAHSVWFTLLGETGFLGLTLFLLCVRAAFSTTRHVVREILNSKMDNDWGIYLIFANSLTASLIAFCVAGSFLAQSYTITFYFLFALSLALRHTYENHLLKIGYT